MLIDVRYLLLGLLIVPWREPIPDLMRFDIPLFLKDVPRAGPISVLLSHVSLSHPLFPDASNAFNQQLADELLNAAERCSTDTAIRAVILTGEGRMFCGGGDVAGFADASDAMGELLKSLTANLHRAISLFQRMNAPLVIAVNGVAAGAGMSFVLTGDVVYAAESAKFTMAYTKIGLSPDCSSTYFLPRLIGLMKAKALMLRNPVLSAAEAQELGIVTEVVPGQELLQAARSCAEELAAGPTRAYGEVKRRLIDSFTNSLEAQIEQETVAIAGLADGTTDVCTGCGSCLAKAAPGLEGA